MKLKESVQTGNSLRLAQEITARDRIGPIGKVTVTQITTRYGIVEDEHICLSKNLVLSLGREHLAEQLVGDSTKTIAWLALGTDKTTVPAPILTETDLSAEVYRVAYSFPADSSYPAVGIVKISRTVTGDEFSTATIIREGGMVLSDGTAAQDSGTLFNRVIFIDDNIPIGLVNAGLVFQPTNASGVAINNRIEFEIIF